MKRYSLHMVLGLVLAFVAACASGPVAQNPNETKIVLIYVSDLHSQLVEGGEGLGGYSRILTLLNNERAKAGPKTDVVLVIGGDIFGKGRVPCRKTNETGCAPLVGLMKPDVVSFGNGELKLGHSELDALAKQVGGVWVGTNVEGLKKNRAKFWRDSFLYTAPKSGLKLNFISTSVFPGPGEAKVGSQIEFVETAIPFASTYEKLSQGVAAAPVLILHDDVKRIDEVAQGVCAAAAKPLLVLKAHEHRVDQGKRGCMTYVEAGAFGRQVARIEIVQGAKSLHVKDVKFVKMDSEITKDAAMETRVEALYKSAGHGARRVMVKLNQDLSQEKVGRFLALAYKKVSKADIAIVNSGAIKEGLTKGQIDWEAVLNAVPYNNELNGLDWSAADLERSLCQAAKRAMDRRLDNGSDLILFGAELKDAGKDNCRLVVDGGKKNPKIVVDSYMVVRSARWLGKELKGKTFPYGLDTERALELGIERYGSQEL